MIKVEGSSVVLPRNCIALMAPSNVLQARTTHKKMTLLKYRREQIRNSLIKALDNKPNYWTYVIEYVLFFHPFSKYASTKYFPFEFFWNGKPVLLIYIKHKIKDTLNLDLCTRNAVFH